MTTWMKRAAAVALVALPLTAYAFGPGERPHGPPDAERIAAHLADELGLDDATAAEVAGVLEASHAEGETLRARAEAEAEALRSALAGGDEKAMKAAMKELQRVRDDGEAHRRATAEEVKALLTVEQQARFTLMHLERHHREREMMQRMREMRESRDELGGLRGRGL